MTDRTKAAISDAENVYVPNGCTSQAREHDQQSDNVHRRNHRGISTSDSRVSLTESKGPTSTLRSLEHYDTARHTHVAYFSQPATQEEFPSGFPAVSLEQRNYASSDGRAIERKRNDHTVTRNVSVANETGSTTAGKEAAQPPTVAQKTQAPLPRRLSPNRYSPEDQQPLLYAQQRIVDSVLPNLRDLCVSARLEAVMKPGVLFRSARNFAPSVRVVKEIFCDMLDIVSVIDLRDDDLTTSPDEQFSRALVAQVYGLQLPLPVLRDIRPSAAAAFLPRDQSRRQKSTRETGSRNADHHTVIDAPYQQFRNSPRSLPVSGTCCSPVGSRRLSTSQASCNPSLLTSKGQRVPSNSAVENTRNTKMHRDFGKTQLYQTQDCIVGPSQSTVPNTSGRITSDPSRHVLSSASPVKTDGEPGYEGSFLFRENVSRPHHEQGDSVPEPDATTLPTARLSPRRHRRIPPYEPSHSDHVIKSLLSRSSRDCPPAHPGTVPPLQQKHRGSPTRLSTPAEKKPHGRISSRLSATLAYERQRRKLFIVNILNSPDVRARIMETVSRSYTLPLFMMYKLADKLTGSALAPYYFCKYFISAHDILESYLEMLKHCGVNFCKALKIITLADVPILFHCTLGKDRTGIVAILILSVLGASDEAIVHDYTLTEHTSETFAAFKYNFTVRESGLTEKFVHAHPDTCRGTLAFIRRSWGSVDGYLDWIGFSLEWRDALRNKLLLTTSPPGEQKTADEELTCRTELTP